MLVLIPVFMVEPVVTASHASARTSCARRGRCTSESRKPVRNTLPAKAPGLCFKPEDLVAWPRRTALLPNGAPHNCTAGYSRYLSTGYLRDGERGRRLVDQAIRFADGPRLASPPPPESFVYKSRASFTFQCPIFKSYF